MQATPRRDGKQRSDSQWNDIQILHVTTQCNRDELYLCISTVRSSRSSSLVAILDPDIQVKGKSTLITGGSRADEPRLRLGIIGELRIVAGSDVFVWRLRLIASRRTTDERVALPLQCDASVQRRRFGRQWDNDRVDERTRRGCGSAAKAKKKDRTDRNDRDCREIGREFKGNRRGRRGGNKKRLGGCCSRRSGGFFWRVGRWFCAGP